MEQIKNGRHGATNLNNDQPVQQTIIFLHGTNQKWPTWRKFLHSMVNSDDPSPAINKTVCNFQFSTNIMQRHKGFWNFWTTFQPSMVNSYFQSPVIVIHQHITKYMANIAIVHHQSLHE